MTLGVVICLPKTQFIKEIIDKLDFTKIRNFCSAKDSIKNEKTNHKTGRKYLYSIHLGFLVAQMVKNPGFDS